MDWDDVVYLILLLASIGFGPIIRKIEDVSTRQWASTAVGLAFIWIVSGIHILHPVILIFMNSMILRFVPISRAHVVSFVCCFAYLVFFRITDYFGIPLPTSHANAIQMILTLKMVGLTNEIQDTHKWKKSADLSDSLEARYNSVSPSFMDAFHYGFCHVGVLTGPYYKYRTYWDMFHTPYSNHADLNSFLMNRMKRIPLYAILYLIASQIWPLKYAESQEIFEMGVFYRLWYMTPLFFIFRMRIYTGFILSECQAISFGLGIYPVNSKPQPGRGPTNLEALKELDDNPSLLKGQEYNYEAIHNINEYGAEFTCTTREAMHTWNMTVQYWLAVFVYKRVTNKVLRVPFTFLTSALWHGVYSGYYLSLLNVPFIFMAEGIMAKAFRDDASPMGKGVFDFLSWFFKMQGFAYNGIAFSLLEINVILNYWWSIYFIGHFLIAGFYILGLLVVKSRKKRNCSPNTTAAISTPNNLNKDKVN